MRHAQGFVFAALCPLFYTVFASPIPDEETSAISYQDKAQEGSGSFDWDNVKPNEKLVWRTCFEGTYECARLVLPMDWAKPHESNVTLALIKHPAKAKFLSSATGIMKMPQLPPLFFNPGGPGASGVQELRAWTSRLRDVVGVNMDLISWDPRGVGLSTPRVECRSHQLKREMEHFLRDQGEEQRLETEYSFQRRINNHCEKEMGESQLLHHMGTGHHALDLAAILDRLGRHKLRYWGFSWGTVLGCVFATMFPNRVERLINDGELRTRDWCCPVFAELLPGNINCEGWFNSDFSSWLQDLDTVIEAFDTSCFNAGPNKCALHAPSPEAIKQRRVNLLEKLKKSPIYIRARSTDDERKRAQLATYSDVMDMTLDFAQMPYAGFPRLANLYAQLEQGQAQEFLRAASELSAQDAPTSIRSIWQPLTQELNMDAHRATLCADTHRGNETPEETKRATRKLRGISAWAGSHFNGNRLACAGWTSVPSARFYIAPKSRTATAHPILFLGNAADPITPLDSAYSNSAEFVGSVVVKQASYGHTSFSPSSSCIKDVVRAYIRSGSLPDNNMVCTPEEELFSGQTLRKDRHA